MIEFNINHYVCVKLTEEGREELKRQHEELYSVLPERLRDTTFTPKKEDSDGWSKWQMWSLMNTFGHMVRIGVKQPFETTIKIEDV